MVHCRHRDHAHWTLPGGGIEPGESGEEAALRELWEEAGVRGAEPTFLYERPWGREQRGDIERCYLVRVSPEQEPALGGDPEADGNHELDAVAWRSLDEVREDTQVSLVLAALAARGGGP